MKTVRRTLTAASPPAVPAEERPTFYALDSGAWRDYVTLLHPPYTLWHLSYVVLGAALAPTLRYDRLGATLLAFFLAVGIAAHALDELKGRPLGTRIPSPILIILAAVGMAGAAGLGLLGTAIVSPWLLVFVTFGAFILLAYNLELFAGRFHTDFWFALAWGAFPLLTACWASAERLGLAAGVGAAAAFALSLAQRALSSRVRAVRRRVQDIVGSVTYSDGASEVIDRRWALAADERVLMLLALAVITLSVAALLSRA